MKEITCYYRIISRFLVDHFLHLHKQQKVTGLIYPFYTKLRAKCKCNYITFILALSSSTDCSRPLGMTNQAIKDWQLAASSAKSRADDPQCAVKHARLHKSGGKNFEIFECTKLIDK